ncbi:MAG TPA: phosphate ABC transporter substrate-binding protein PstS [Chthoniobacterales bacterium]|nr:phosphate ABC transporter substrate-binding protein PstS [Chthoniobacterales bacterium]
MKTSEVSFLLVATLATQVLLGSASAATQLQGAGATFPAPLYQRWIAEYTKGNPDVQINYQGVGSGAGIKQFTQNLVSFGASDAAMKDEEIAAVKQGVVLIPATAGSIVLAYNLPGVENLKLSREAYVGIFLGKITKWNDPAIAKTNAGVNLPNLAVTVCERSDGSGTNFVFTKHLSAISPEFKDQVGEGTSVTWPTGVAGKGNDGVTALIKQNKGAIGYVEYGYAKNNKLSFAALQNKAGEFVTATTASGAATLATTQFPANLLRAWPSDPEGKEAYPISTFTWLLLYKKYDNTQAAEAVKKFVNYGLTEGQKFAEELGYIPLPKEVIDKNLEALKTVQ